MIYYLTLNIILTIVLNYAWLVNQTSLEPLDEPVKLVPLHYTLSRSLSLSPSLSLTIIIYCTTHTFHIQMHAIMVSGVVQPLQSLFG